MRAPPLLVRLAVVVLALATACGEPEESGPKPLIQSFTASSQELPDGGGEVTLSWEVEGAATLRIDNGVGDVSASGSKTVRVTTTTQFKLTAANPQGITTGLLVIQVNTAQFPPSIGPLYFAPALLPYGGGTTQLSWSTINARSLTLEPGVGDVTGTTSRNVSVNRTTVFKLTATNSAGTSTATATVTVSPTVDIQGRVLNAAGRPVSGMQVLVSGTAPIELRPDGTFARAGVLPPYHVLIASDTQVTVYQGLRRPDPTLIVENEDGSDPIPATVRGTYRGALLPDPGSPLVMRAALESSEYAPYEALASQFKPDGTYSFGFRMLGPDRNAAGTFHMLQWQKSATGRTLAFTGHGSLDNVQFVPFSTFVADMTLSPIGTRTVDGTLAVPTGQNTPRVSGYVLFGENAISVDEQTPETPFNRFSLKAPGVMPMNLRAVTPPNASLESSSFQLVGLEASTTPVELTLPAIPRLASPPSGASNVPPDFQFLVAGSARGLRVVRFTPSTKSPSPNTVAVTLVTTADSITLPSFSELGRSVGTNTRYNWSVTEWTSFDSMEAATGPGAYLDRPARSFGRANSTTWTFTFAP